MDPKQKAYARHKAKARSATAASLELRVEDDDEWHRTEKQIKKKLVIAEREAKKKGFELDYRNIPGVETANLFEETPLKYEAGLKKIGAGGIRKKTEGAIPESWEDEM
jgi:hypothetical protein